MCVFLSFVGNTEIEVDVKRYYCKAGIKSVQVRRAAFSLLFLLIVFAQIWGHMLTRQLRPSQVWPSAVLLIMWLM